MNSDAANLRRADYDALNRSAYCVGTHMKKKPNKLVVEQIATDSDEHFAYIAGYTEGGASYGVTWEEMEAVERSASAPRSREPTIQGTPVSLNDIVQEMLTIFDTMTVYFKRRTGEFITVNHVTSAVVLIKSKIVE